MWHVYIVQNSLSGRFYVGCTSDLETRVKQHKVKRKRKWSGRQQGEWFLVYKELFDQKTKALLREKEIKSKKSRRYIERLIKNRISGLGSSISLA